jgi:hypothetical protein
MTPLLIAVCSFSSVAALTGCRLLDQLATELDHPRRLATTSPCPGVDRLRVGVVTSPLLILADSYAQADAYAAAHNLGPPGVRWRYVSGQRDVAGRVGPGRFVRITTGAGSRQDFAVRLIAAHRLVAAGFVEVPAP